MAASKVPKFGTWGEGENYTVYFENARKNKSNGPMINPNDPEENPEMFRQNGAPSPARSPPPTTQGQEHKSKVPQFGAWDNEDNNVGYTVYFDNARKTKPNGPTNTENRAQQPHNGPRAQVKPEPQAQEARSKVPEFGAWGDNGGGEVGYTVAFENVRKNKSGPTTHTTEEASSNGPPRNGPQAQEGRSKVPEFGAWGDGGEVGYTTCFDNVRKGKNVGGGQGSTPNYEPQLNRDVGERARVPPSGAAKPRPEQRGGKEEGGRLRNASQGSTASNTGSEAGSRPGRQAPGGGAQRGGRPQSRPASRGSQTPERGGASIPTFGVWNQDPAQAEGFTGVFQRAREERNTPLNSNAPPPYHQNQTHHSKQQKKKGRCFPWFR